eukprot:UN29366
MEKKFYQADTENDKLKRLINTLRLQKKDLHDQFIECQSVIHKLAKMNNLGSEQIKKMLTTLGTSNIIGDLQDQLTREKAEKSQLKTALEILRDQVSRRSYLSSGYNKQYHKIMGMGYDNHDKVDGGGADAEAINEPFDVPIARMTKLQRIVKNLGDHETIFNAKVALKTIKGLEDELGKTTKELRQLHESYKSAVNRI